MITPYPDAPGTQGSSAAACIRRLLPFRPLPSNTFGGCGPAAGVTIAGSGSGALTDARIGVVLLGSFLMVQVKPRELAVMTAGLPASMVWSTHKPAELRRCEDPAGTHWPWLLMSIATTVSLPLSWDPATSVDPCGPVSPRARFCSTHGHAVSGAVNVVSPCEGSVPRSTDEAPAVTFTYSCTCGIDIEPTSTVTRNAGPDSRIGGAKGGRSTAVSREGDGRAGQYAIPAKRAGSIAMVFWKLSTAVASRPDGSILSTMVPRFWPAGRLTVRTSGAPVSASATNW